jgi:hypothetical protein
MPSYSESGVEQERLAQGAASTKSLKQVEKWGPQEVLLAEATLASFFHVRRWSGILFVVLGGVIESFKPTR